MHEPDDIATRFLGRPYAELNEPAKKVARHVAKRQQIVRVMAEGDGQPPSRGQRAADAVARFGGSWVFVGLFGLVMLAWIGTNTWMVARHGSSFDPYPFILLNLFLSMLAAIQAPVILMSQNRQAEKDRQTAEHDYEINLKAELEILLLHDKIDALRQAQWESLMKLQSEQLALLKMLAAKSAPAA